MKYFHTDKAGSYKEYLPADNETIQLGNDGVHRVLVDTGTETYHKPDLVLKAVDEEKKEEVEEAEEKVKEDKKKDDKKVEEKVKKEEEKKEKEDEEKKKKK